MQAPWLLLAMALLRNAKVYALSQRDIRTSEWQSYNARMEWWRRCGGRRHMHTVACYGGWRSQRGGRRHSLATRSSWPQQWQSATTSTTHSCPRRQEVTLARPMWLVEGWQTGRRHHLQWARSELPSLRSPYTTSVLGTSNRPAPSFHPPQLHSTAPPTRRATAFRSTVSKIGEVASQMCERSDSTPTP